VSDEGAQTRAPGGTAVIVPDAGITFHTTNNSRKERQIKLILRVDRRISLRGHGVGPSRHKVLWEHVVGTWTMPNLEKAGVETKCATKRQ
jgi:Trm5-related predicted tRNA methylase